MWKRNNVITVGTRRKETKTKRKSSYLKERRKRYDYGRKSEKKNRHTHTPKAYRIFIAKVMEMCHRPYVYFENSHISIDFPLNGSVEQEEQFSSWEGDGQMT